MMQLQSCNEDNISSTGQPILIGTKTVEKSEMLAIIKWIQIVVSDSKC
jgi:preprotein translocase subunit SecA